MPKKLAGQRIKGVFERPAGSDVWWINYTVNGKRIREKIGSKKKAHEAYKKRSLADWTDAKLAGMMFAGRGKSVKFAELVDDALEHAKQRNQRDTKTLPARLRRLKEEFGDQEARSITPDIIDTWLSQNTKSPATSNRFKAAFSKVFKLALRNRKVMSNPASLVEPHKEPGGRIRWIAKGSDEEQRLHSAILKLSAHRLPELVISMGTGMRLSEQYSLSWKDVDFAAGQFGYVRLDKTKNGSYRDIPMSPQVKAAFLEVRGDVERSPDERVFSNKTPVKWFMPALAEAKITDYTWHCNRHSFCSRLAKGGAHIKTIQVLAGHKTMAMSARYTHMEDDTVAAAVLNLV